MACSQSQWCWMEDSASNWIFSYVDVSVEMLRGKTGCCAAPDGHGADLLGCGEHGQSLLLHWQQPGALLWAPAGISNKKSKPNFSVSSNFRFW